jgi:hypothetical protein
MLDYDKLNSYKDYVIQITNSRSGEMITGLYDDEELSYGTNIELGSSSFGGFTDEAMSGAAGQLAEKFLGRFSGLAGSAKNMIQGNLKSINSTIKGYEGSGDNSFSLSFHIFPGGESYNSILNKIYKYTQPDTDDTNFMRSHLYSIQDAASLLTNDNAFKGQLLHVSIGDWFFATGLFCNGINHSFSKFVDENGAPIYMAVNIGFVSYRTLTAAELASWIRK